MSDDGGLSLLLLGPAGATGLYWALSGQLTESPLVNNVQFAAGGVGSVRGW